MQNSFRQISSTNPRILESLLAFIAIRCKKWLESSWIFGKELPKTMSSVGNLKCHSFSIYIIVDTTEDGDNPMP